MSDDFPTIDVECPGCGLEIEIEEPGWKTGPTDRECYSCGSTVVARMVSLPGDDYDLVVEIEGAEQENPGYPL